MESHAPRLKHVGVETPKRSTLADANALRPANVFAELFKADHLITDYRYLRWRHLALQDQVGLSEPRFAWPLAVPPDYSARA